MDGGNICNEDDIYATLCHQGGVRGYITILFDSANFKGPVLKNRKEFKASETRVRETHELTWTNETPYVYTTLGITAPEIVTQMKIDNYESNLLQASILSTHQSTKPP